MYLYKYMEPQHAEGLMKSGTVRIGTLYEYRSSEDKRADKMEGSRIFEMRGKSVDTSQNTPEAKHLRQLGFKNCYIDNSNQPSIPLMVTERLSKDRYIYCTSSDFDENNMKKFGGACIRIKDPELFFSIIGAYLHEKGLTTGEWGVGPIFYCKRDKVYTFNEEVPRDIPGWRIKPSLFSSEKEVRVAWMATKETDLKPVLVLDESENYRTLTPEKLSIPQLCGSDSFERIA